MIHIDREGNVIGSFDPPQGHGMAVDNKGFVYIGNTVNGLNTVRKYDPKTGEVVAEVPRVPRNSRAAAEAAIVAPKAYIRRARPVGARPVALLRAGRAVVAEAIKIRRLGRRRSLLSSPSIRRRRR